MSDTPASTLDIQSMASKLYTWRCLIIEEMLKEIGVTKENMHEYERQIYPSGTEVFLKNNIVLLAVEPIDFKTMTMKVRLSKTVTL